MRDPYNFDYAFAILPDEVYQSKKMRKIFYARIPIYIPLAENPVQYLRDQYDSENAHLERSRA